MQTSFTSFSYDGAFAAFRNERRDFARNYIQFTFIAALLALVILQQHGGGLFATSHSLVAAFRTSLMHATLKSFPTEKGPQGRSREEQGGRRNFKEGQYLPRKAKTTCWVWEDTCGIDMVLASI